MTNTKLADPCLALWQAMNEAEKVGRRTDDKLIVKFLREAGYCIAPIAAHDAQQAQAAQAVPAGFVPIEGAVFEDGGVSLIRRGSEDARVAARPGCERIYRLAAAQAAPAPEALNLNDRAVQKRLAAQWGYVLAPAPEAAQAVPSRPQWSDDDRQRLHAYLDEWLGLAAPAPEAQAVPADMLPSAEHIKEIAGELVTQAMEQAQVFASAWALVGSRFDAGNEMDNAEQQKDDLRTIIQTLADLAAAPAAPAPAPEAPTLTHELQQQCSDWGVYWRASDAHGVDLSIEQAEELLRRALGVEVVIAKAEPQAQAAGQELPPLPKPAVGQGYYAGGGPDEGASEDLWDAEQMHAYARAALAQRQPLTDEQIETATAQIHMNAPMARWSIARAVERAHGISGATTGEQQHG